MRKKGWIKWPKTQPSLHSLARHSLTPLVFLVLRTCCGETCDMYGCSRNLPGSHNGYHLQYMPESLFFILAYLKITLWAAHVPGLQNLPQSLALFFLTGSGGCQQYRQTCSPSWWNISRTGPLQPGHNCSGIVFSGFSEVIPFREDAFSPFL